MFNTISTHSIWLISTCLIIIRTIYIFKVPLKSFSNRIFYSSIISFYSVIYQVFLIIWFQAFLSNTNNFQTSVEHIDGTLTSTTTLGLSGPESNGNKELIDISQGLRAGVSPPDVVWYHTQDIDINKLR